MWRFLWDFQLTVLAGALGRAEVQAWPADLSQLDVTTDSQGSCPRPAGPGRTAWHP